MMKLSNNKDVIIGTLAAVAVFAVFSNAANAEPPLVDSSTVVTASQEKNNNSSNSYELERLRATKVALVVSGAQGSKPKYSAKDILSDQELKQILHSVGFRGEALRVAWAVAKKESSGRPMAHNDNENTGDNSYGLFQINMMGSMGPDRLKKFDLDKNTDLFDPVRNAEIAFFMSNGGKNWSSWHGITPRTKEFMKEFPN
jgi:hypothetical protein